MEKHSKWDQLSDSDSLEPRRKRASQILGISTDSLSKARQVVDSGNKELIEQMDRRGNISGAYKKVRNEKLKNMLLKIIY